MRPETIISEAIYTLLLKSGVPVDKVNCAEDMGGMRMWVDLLVPHGSPPRSIAGMVEVGNLLTRAGVMRAVESAAAAIIESYNRSEQDMRKKRYVPPPTVVQSTTPLMLMPAAPGLCSICATKHEPDQPHNQQSIHYQYWFYASSGGRWPTWIDAMAHCSDEVKKFWITELGKKGVKVESPVTNPKEPAPMDTERKFELNEE